MKKKVLVRLLKREQKLTRQALKVLKLVYLQDITDHEPAEDDHPGAPIQAIGLRDRITVVEPKQPELEYYR